MDFMIQKEKFHHQNKAFKSTITDPIINILTYADGKNSLLDISDKINLPIWELYDICQLLHKKKTNIIEKKNLRK